MFKHINIHVFFCLIIVQLIKINNKFLKTHRNHKYIKRQNKNRTRNGFIFADLRLTVHAKWAITTKTVNSFFFVQAQSMFDQGWIGVRINYAHQQQQQKNIDVFSYGFCVFLWIIFCTMKKRKTPWQVIDDWECCGSCVCIFALFAINPPLQARVLFLRSMNRYKASLSLFFLCLIFHFDRSKSFSCKQ